MAPFAAHRIIATTGAIGAAMIGAPAPPAHLAPKPASPARVHAMNRTIDLAERYGMDLAFAPPWDAYWFTDVETTDPECHHRGGQWICTVEIHIYDENAELLYRECARFQLRRGKPPIRTAIGCYTEPTSLLSN